MKICVIGVFNILFVVEDYHDFVEVEKDFKVVYKIIVVVVVKDEVVQLHKVASYCNVVVGFILDIKEDYSNVVSFEKKEEKDKNL